jgi:hypothetical protein
MSFRPIFRVMLINEGKYKDGPKAGQTFQRAEGLVQTMEGGPLKACSIPISKKAQGVEAGKAYELSASAFLNEKGQLQFYVDSWVLQTAKPAAVPARAA